MTDTQLFVARLRGSSADAPAFTGSANIDELMAALVKRLPADLVYLVVPSGNGYSLREVGQIVLDFKPAEHQSLPATPPPSSSPRTGYVYVSPAFAPGRDLAPEPTLTVGDETKIAPTALPGAINGKPRKRRATHSATAAQDMGDVQTSERHTISHGGRLETNGFIEATPEQSAAAASPNLPKN